MKFTIAKTKGQIAFCKEVLFAFRTNLDDKTYVERILKMIEDERFKLVYIPSEDHTKVVAFIGYRILSTLRTGRMIYIDDLYTNPEHRGKGYAGALLDYVDKEAIKTNIASIHLDSGYALYNAHRLYLNKRYVLACNHFTKRISLSI